MKPRNPSEWGTAIAALAAFVGGTFDAILGGWAPAIALFALGLVQWVGIYAKRSAYYCGWMAGRTNLFDSMSEAGRRDMSPADFWTSVVEKDTAMTVDQMSKRQYRRLRERMEAERP